MTRQNEKPENAKGSAARRASGGRTGRLGGAVRLGALVVAAVLALAGCGGSSSPTAGAGGSAGSQALAYAQCMRAHGVPNFPDPNAQGAFYMPNTGGVDQTSPQYQSATAACAHLMPEVAGSPQSIGAGNPAQSLKYAECMRSHGISGYPDPSSNGGLQPLSGKGDLNPNNPQFQAANNACKSLLPS